MAASVRSCNPSRFFRPVSICCGALQERICTAGEGRICRTAPAPSDAKVWRAKTKTMTNGTLVIFRLVIYSTISTMQWCSKPGVTRSSPSAVILSTMRWQTEKLGTIQQSNVFTRLRCVSRPCQMLRSLRRRCQPLGQPAACLSSVDPFRLRPAPICSDLFEETDDDHDEGDKTKLESQIAQLIQNSHRITHRESSQENYHRHHERREREREREKGRGGGMRR